jgi:L-amino acid N-acyltransferase YncA
MLKFNKTNESDFPEIWRIYQAIIKKGDSYLDNPSKTDIEYARNKWLNPNSINITAKINQDIVGFYSLRNNYKDYGSHVANGSYIVNPDFCQQGFGKKIALHSIDEAKKAGYKAMQFNFVVATNIAAIKLWKSVGFNIVGTTPKSYQHQGLNKLVDSHIMHRFL